MMKTNKVTLSQVKKRLYTNNTNLRIVVTHGILQQKYGVGCRLLRLDL